MALRIQDFDSGQRGSHLSSNGFPSKCHYIWHSTDARFSSCFRPILSIIPLTTAIFFLIYQVLRLGLSRVPVRRPRWTTAFVQEFVENRQETNGKQLGSQLTRSTIALFIITLIGLTLEITNIILDQQYLAIVLFWISAILLLVIERPRTTSYSLLAMLCTMGTYQVIVITDYGAVRSIRDLPEILTMITTLTGISVLLRMPMRDPSLDSKGISPTFTRPTSQLRSPEDNLNLFQFMTVSWVSPLLTAATKGKLNEEDVWGLAYEFQHQILHQKFRNLRGSVLSRILSANAIDLILISILGVLELLANLSAPVLLQKLLQSMENPMAPKRAAVTYAVLSLTVRLIASQSSVLKLWFSRRAYERSRGEMITMLSEKTLMRKMVGGRKTTPTSKSEGNDADERASMGKILNLIRFDAYEIAQRFWEFDSLISQPLGVILSVILIWQIIGWPCLIGVSTVLLAQTINALLAKGLLKWEKTRRVATDIKLQKISQFVESIRHLRWYGWQDVWLNGIMESRHAELRLRVITRLWNISINFFNMLGSGMFPVAAFYAYTALAGKPLRIDIAFPALQLFSMLEDSLTELPGLFTALLNAYVALGRVESFMHEPDKQEEEQDLSPLDQLELKRASFAWPGSTQLILHEVSLTFPIGLTVICGQVAAGKSALLQSLLGEMDKLSGEIIRPKDPIGYCAQTPWLQSMSIRDNILFSAPYEPLRYHEVLDACALLQDMANFKHGDLTNIGENGVGLSGGQKARVALARAIYSKCTTLILDDPISALDHQTAESIIRKCLAGPLVENRTVIMVTHRTDLCHGVAKQVVEVLDGRTRILDPDTAFFNSLQLIQSTESVDENIRERNLEAAIPDKVIDEEERQHGGVKASVYWEYIKAGKIKWWIILVLMLVLFRAIDVLENWFIKSWGEAYGKENTRVTSGLLETLRSSDFHSKPWGNAYGKEIIQVTSGLFDNLPSPEVNIKPWLIGFFLLATAQAIAYLISQAFMLIIIYSSGRQMFTAVMNRVGHATFRFYDATPVGRLMNRLTGDIGTIDGNISMYFNSIAMFSIGWITSIIVIASVTPIFLIFSVALTLSFVTIFSRFLPASQSLRRLEMVSLSPLMSNFGTMLYGMTTIRAFCAQSRFQDRVITVTEVFQRMDHQYWTSQAWLGYRFDNLSACSSFALTLIALYTGISPGLTAFVLTAASRFVISTHMICRLYGELQMDFVSVERVVELLDLEQEPPGNINPPAWWPTKMSDIVFEDVTIRYAPHLDPALSNLSLRIKGGSSVALLGRTGSGKSTLALSLLATSLPESGRILIDNIDISTVNKEALRKRVTFLAQEPVLFPGSMRANLDPLEEYSDEECDVVLQKIAKRHQWTLDTVIDTGGGNLSQGQRQLVGLARALLRRSPIVIFDEATASIDYQTSLEVQKILRDEMKDSTVITIAHRLEAVKDADSCIVLGKGRVIEQGDSAEMM